jgi:hypothetical protein
MPSETVLPHPCLQRFYGRAYYQRDYVLSADKSKTGKCCALFSAVKLHSYHILSVTTSGHTKQTVAPVFYCRTIVGPITVAARCKA